MVDPFNPETEFDLASISEREREAINSLFAPAGPQQEIQSFLSAPSVNLAQAQKLIETRDNPQSIDILGGLATRFKEGKLPFNQQSLGDAVKNARDYSLQVQPQLMEAEKKNDWMELTKLSLGGVGKTLASFLQAGLGITNQEAEITQQSLAARNYIGQIKDPEQAAKALELGSLYQDELTAGKSIAPKDEKPAMAFGTGPLTAKLGMNLAMAENYLRDLESDSSKKLGTASLRNFAIQSGDAFLPFVSIGDIVVDENNPDLVARRAALSNSINDTIQKDYMTGTLAGSAIGSVGSFIGVGGIATKALGRAAQIGDRSLKIPTVLSKGATYATIGASQSFESDPRELSVAQRLSSVFSEGAILGLAEGAGNKLEESIDSAMANYVAAKALATKIPELAPLVGSTGKIVGVTLGETASEEIEAVLRGQDPIEPLLQNLAVSGGIGLGMAIPGISGSIVARRNKIYAMADDRFATSLEQTLRGIKTDPKLDDPRKMEEIAKLRGSLTSPKAQTLFDALNVRASVDPTLAPETAKVADEVINKSKQGTVESMLTQEIAKAEGQIGTPATFETRAPLTEEEGASALNEVINAFDKGETSIDLSNTPENASKIQWLEDQGRIIGEFSEDGKIYSITNAKKDSGNWFRGTPPIEFEQDLKDAFVMQAEEAVDDVEVEGVPSKQKRFTREDLDAMELALDKAGTLGEIDDVVELYLTPDESQNARETLANKLNESVDAEKQAQRDSKLLQDRINGLEKQIKELPSDEAVPLIDMVNQLKQRQEAITNQRTEVGEQSVTSLVKQYEEEASIDSKNGKLAKELEEYPDILPAILNERNKSNQEFNKLPPDPRENEKTALSEVFNLKNPSTVDLLESLGALDENGRELKTPAETLAAYVERKKSYLNGKSLAGYRRYDISDLVSAATLNTFFYELRRGKSNLSLSVIFNSRLREFIRRAVPRMRAGVGQGAAISLETPGLRTNAVDAETLAEEQGINPNLAEVVNESLDQLAASEIENQLKNPSDVPSEPQRQEALSILGQNMLAPFRESLKTEAEKIAFDSVVENKPITEQDIIRSNLDAEKFAALKLVVRKNFGQALKAEYRKNQLAGTLPFREVVEPEGLVKAGNLTGQQIKPYRDKFLSLKENSVFNDDEIENLTNLLDNVQNTRATPLLRAFDKEMDNIVQRKTSPEGIAEIADFIDNELDLAVENGSMSQEQADNIVAQIAELSKPYQELLSSPESEQRTKAILNYRSNLLRVGDEVEKIKKGKNEQPIAKQKVETPVTKRERVSKEFPAKESERASTTKRVSQETVPVKREEVGRTVAGKTTGAGRPRVARDRGTPVEAKFISARNQRDFKQQDLVTILAPLGKQVNDALNENQKQNAAAGIMAIENSKHNAFYLADGPGTAKTRPLLAIGKSQLDKPNSQVIYLTLADAVTPNWDKGTIGGSIQKDAQNMGIPITARGPKGKNGLGKPIEKTPGKILVTTYSSYPAENLQEVLKIVDKDTTVIMDEYHAGRNLFKKSGDTAFGQLMDDISKKAGKVVMASGTPFETPDQLLPLGRLGIFDTESPEALFSRLGYKKDYKITSIGEKSKKLSWVKLEGLTDEQVFNRINEYFENGLIKDGLFRSKRLSLEGVKINFKKIKLDDNVIKKLDDIKSMYGGAQNTEPNVLQALADTQRKILEEYKATNVVAPLVIDSVRRGRKAIVYVGFVDSKGDTTNTSAKLLEEALLKINPNLKIAKMYSKSGETKEEALLSFNENGAEVIILSKEMGGTGLELDDQFGDEPRDMYLLSTPASAIQTIQVIYRARRLNSASYPTITFIESDAQVDQATISKMREKLGVLGATVEAGFEGLRGKTKKTITTEPTKVVAPLRSDVVATPDQVSIVNEELKSILGENFDGEKITLKDSKNKEHIYNVKVNPESVNVFAYQMGSDNDSDFISINPVRLAQMKAIMSPEQFRQYVLRAVYIHETAHADTATIFRERGENPFDEIRAIGQEFSNEYSLAVSRFYWSLLGSDINNPEIQAKIIAFAKDPYLVAMEAIRLHSELAAGFGVTEDIFALSPESRKLALSRLDDLLSLEKKDQSKLIKWFKTLVTVMQQKLGMIPSAKDRIVMKPYVDEAISHLRKVTSSLQKQGKITPVPSPEVNLSPSSPRPADTFDSYDLRIYRMIENHLEGRTDNVLGVTVADDMFKTVGVEEWLNALDTYTRRKAITPEERTIFRDATRVTMDGQRVSLPQMTNKALEIAENLEAAGKSIPVQALVSTSAPAEITTTEQNYIPEPTYRDYRVQIPGQLSAETRAVSEAKATANAVIRLFERQEVVNYNGQRYTSPGPLIAALRDAGYGKFAKVISPAPTSEVKARVSLPSLFNLEKNGELAYHGTRLDQVTSLLGGIRPETNFSPDFNGQAFGADVVLVYPKNQLSLDKKSYQNDLVLTQESATQPVAAMLDVANFEGSEARRSYSDVMEDIANLPKEDSDIAMDLYAALDLGDKRKAAQIRDDIRGNPAAIEKQIRDMRIKEFKGKYYLPTGEQIFSLPKAQPKPNSEAINRLAVELSKASDEAVASVSQEQAINNAMASIPNDLPVFTYELSESGRVTNVKTIRAGAPTAAPAPEIRESRAVKNIVTQFVDVLPEGKVKDKLLDAWYYQSVPREQQFADAKSYIATNGLQNSLNAFLSGNIKSSLPLQGAIGFELAKSLGPKAKTDLFAKQQLVDVMLVLSKRYGTEVGQTVDLWNALNELASNPEAMKMFLDKQIDTAVKGRLKGYASEEEDIASGLKDASRRATEKLITGSSTKNILEKISKLVDLNKKGATVAKIEAALAEYVESEEAMADGREFLGADLAAAPEVGASDADNIRLDPKQTKALARMIIQIIERSENPSVTAASEEQIKAFLLMTRAFQDAKNPDDVRRKLDIYFEASLANALEIYSSKVIGDARAREGIEPPADRGEANRRVQKAKAKVKAQAPVSIEQGVGDGSIDHALLDAAANKLQQQAEGLQKEPKVKQRMDVLVSRIKSYIATNTKAEGGLQPAYEPLPKPTEAEVFQDLVANHPETMRIFYGIRDSLKDNFSEEELVGLEPFIQEMFKSPYTESSLKKTIRSLESIGGPKTNIQGLIRSSKGDLMTFENELGALLTKNTTLDSAQQKEVKDFLREKLASLIASERKAELQKIKNRFEAKKERKTRKMRSSIDKLIEATNLGVLNDSEVFMQMHSQLGLPMLKDAERARLNELVEALPLYPAGMIRNRKISEMYQYVKLVSPQVWGELLVNYQTSNLLAGLGTIGVNAWSAFVSNELNAGILAGLGAIKGLAGNKAKAKAYLDGAIALNASILAGEKPALTAAQNIFFKGDYSNVQDALTQELGGVNIWEAIVRQAEDYRAGKAGTARPELPVNVFGEEYRIPLDSKYLSSKYGALAPFIFFGRAMAAGDAINRISSRKMYEIAEATNIAISKGLTSTEEIDKEVARLLNQSPEARKRAEAKAESEAKEFDLSPGQQSLRVEEILEQGRPDEEEVKNLIEKAKRFAAQTTFTNDFEGWFGLLADGLTTMSSKAWPLRLVIKFLKTGSSLANEIMNFMPLISNARMYFGVGAGLGDTKYYRPPAVPGTVEHDLLLGKMMFGYIITATILAALKDAMSGEDDPYFNLHFKGPSDPAQREAFFAAGGKLRSIQVGHFRDGKPFFISFEGLPVGLSGPLLLSAAINETVRYEKRSKAESILLGLMTGGALAMYGVLDIAALSGIRQIMSLTSPGVGQRDAKGIMTNLAKTAGNVAGGLIPGYATLRDVEQLFDGIMQAPSGRPYQENLLSTFAQSIPFASKVGKRDLDFLGGNTKTQLTNTVPFLRRLITSGVDSKAYDDGDRTPEAVHDKLVSLFAANRSSLDWSAGPLKDFAMMELVKEKQARGEPISVDDFYQLKRELSSTEKYEWLQRAGPVIQQQLGAIIPELEKMSRVEFVTIVPQIVNPIKKAILFQILAEKNQEDVLYPERGTVD